MDERDVRIACRSQGHAAAAAEGRRSARCDGRRRNGLIDDGDGSRRGAAAADRHLDRVAAWCRGVVRVRRGAADRVAVEEPLITRCRAGREDPKCGRTAGSGTDLGRARCDGRGGRDRIHGDGGRRRRRTAAAEQRDDHGVVACRGGDVGLVHRAADGIAVEIPLIARGAA